LHLGTSGLSAEGPAQAKSRLHLGTSGLSAGGPAQAKPRFAPAHIGGEGGRLTMATPRSAPCHVWIRRRALTPLDRPARAYSAPRSFRPALRTPQGGRTDPPQADRRQAETPGPRLLRRERAGAVPDLPADSESPLITGRLVPISPASAQDQGRRSGTATGGARDRAECRAWSPIETVRGGSSLSRH
jgi:hypothetical protein